MLFDNFPLSLPWYPGVRFQDRFRQNVALDPRILQLAPYDGVLPFQFAKPITSEMPVSWSIRCAENRPLDFYINGDEDTIVVDLTSFIPTCIEATTLNGKDYFTFVDNSNTNDLIFPSLPDYLPPGHYYMLMEFNEVSFEGGDHFYVSELFRVPDDRFSWVENSEDCNYPCLTWSNDTDIAPMHYDSTADYPFFNKLYLDTFITATEPVIETEIETDGRNEPIPISHKSIIKYRLSCIVPDFIKIALYVMVMHENKSISLEHGYRFGGIKNPEVTHSLSSDGAFSIVELLFEQMILLFDTQCPENMEEPDPSVLPAGTVLDTEYCDGTGDLYLIVTDMPEGIHGRVEYSIDAGATYTECYGYISREDLTAGITIAITPGLGADHFRVAFYTFTYRAGETDPSIPVSSC